ncbi:MAG: sugar phosphate isomerase/epimerase [bacterium]
MKLGILTDFTEARVRMAGTTGFDCLSVIADPKNKAGRLIATKSGRQKMLDTCAKHGVQICALTAYRLYLDADARVRREAAAWFKTVVKAAEEMKVPVVPALAGRDPSKSIEESIPAFKKIWTPLAKFAADHGVKVAFDNWVGGWDINHGINLAVCPKAWRLMFDAVPNKAMGLEFDPSHLYWQGIDYIRAVHEFGPRIHHVHLKDTEILHEKQYDVGVTGGAFRFRIPGWGEIDWPSFFTALIEVGYRGSMVIEHEDDVFSGDDYDEGFRLGFRYLKPLIPTLT